MKDAIPIGNALIGTLYFILLGINILIIKLTFKHTNSRSLPPGKPIPVSNSNSSSAKLDNADVILVLLRCWSVKYTIFGCWFHEDKRYVMKQLFVLSFFALACSLINTIVIWPVVFAPVFVCIFVLFNTYTKYQSEVSNQLSEEMPQAKNSQGFQTKQVLFLGAVSGLSVIFWASIMVGIYGSVSDLGVLNLQSLLLMMVIDQFARISLGGCVLAAVGWGYGWNVAQIGIFRELIVEKLVEIIEDEQKNRANEICVSPTRKRTSSPSKIPKAQPIYFQNETLMQLQPSLRQEEPIQSPKENTPIKQMYQDGESQIIFTSQEKKMFQGQFDFQENIEINNKKSVEEIKSKIPRQFYSVQRPIKHIPTEEKQEDGDLIIVQAPIPAVLNHKDRMNMNPNNRHPHTIDFTFSPKNKLSHPRKARKNNRQLIIKGSSPYLQYLPDMMKKVSRKSTKHSSTPGPLTQGFDKIVPKKML